MASAAPGREIRRDKIKEVVLHESCEGCKDRGETPAASCNGCKPGYRWYVSGAAACKAQLCPSCSAVPGETHDADCPVICRKTNPRPKDHLFDGVT